MFAVTPWIVRNKFALGQATLSTAMACNLYRGNAAGATWNMGSRASELEPASVTRQIARLREGDAAQLYMKLARAEILADPGRFVKLAIGKAVNFWRLYPNPAARTVGTSQKLLGVLTYGPVLFLAAAWFVCNRRAWKLNLLFASYMAAAMLVSAMTVSVDRYRLPFDLYLIVLAAGAADSRLAHKPASVRQD